MRAKTESGNVVSSHSSACGASSLITNAWIDSRSASCSSVKMKCAPRRGVIGLLDFGRGHSGNLRAAVRLGHADGLRDRPLRRRRPASPRSRSTGPRRATRSPTSCSTTCSPPSRRRATTTRVRCVVLTSTHEKVFSAGGDLGGFAAEAPLVHKHFATDRFPRLFHADRRARQADAVRRQRPRARGRARARARVRPDHRQGGRPLRDARDQRRDLPVHDHGADLPQRRAQEDQRAAAAGRADQRRRRPSGSGSSTASCAAGRVRRRGRRLGGQARRQVAAADAAGQGRDVPPAGHGRSPTRSSTCTRSSRSRSRPTTSRRACKAFFEKREPVWTGR